MQTAVNLNGNFIVDVQTNECRTLQVDYMFSAAGMRQCKQNIFSRYSKKFNYVVQHNQRHEVWQNKDWMLDRLFVFLEVKK